MKLLLLTLIVSITLSNTYATQGHNGKNLKTLKEASEYSATSESSFPEFTYQPSTDSNLVMLRQSYHLDSIAGQGTDIEQAIKLMRWVHNTIRHDGSKGTPDIKNAQSMIETCQSENRTLNCRGLAIVLNEVYLSMGFKSRYVTCMPKDSTDRDCHVINVVFIPSLNKWVWMDPTFEAFVKDELGNYLSIEEVRERLISNKPLVLNEDANWNNQRKQKAKHYLYNYMAKNLYRIECAASSEFNYETFQEGKTLTFIQLIPLDYLNYKASVKESTHGIRGKKEITFTTSPEKFWAVPNL